MTVDEKGEWKRNWRIKWQGPWLILDECSFGEGTELQHNTINASRHGCVCPRSLVIHAQDLRVKHEYNRSQYARLREKISARRRKTRVSIGSERPDIGKTNPAHIPRFTGTEPCMVDPGRSLFDRVITYSNQPALAKDAAKICMTRCAMKDACRRWVVQAEAVPGSWGGVYGGLTVSARRDAAVEA